MKAVHAHVSGRVQQVGFRQACRQVARSLGLVGWARNLADGRVEVWAQGDAEGVDRLVEWLWSGPAMSVVTGVESDMVALDRSLRDFFIQPNPMKSS
ncbi:MAG TPA: acylphosphatase [Acidimicrobiia bacterium]|jgi:acylphosphatase|nr:acylphosphatase [Acidimicrobiia bacterium]